MDLDLSQTQFLRMVFHFGSLWLNYDSNKHRSSIKRMIAEMSIPLAAAFGAASLAQMLASSSQALKTSEEAKDIEWMSAKIENGPNIYSENALLVSVAMMQDREVFALLFDSLSGSSPRIKSYMMKLDAEPDVAEAIAQETFVMIWRKAVQFDAEKTRRAPEFSPSPVTCVLTACARKNV